MLKVRRLAEGFYALEDARVRQFLVLGEERALLFDTGFGDTEVLAAARTLTDLPIDLVLTHGDPDHVGGLGDFTNCRLHPGDWHKITAPVSLTPLTEGDVLRCGRFAFEVIAIPGHTPGSVAFYDRVQKILLPGDSVQQGGPIYMFGPDRDLPRYIQSLEKLAAQIPVDVAVFPCHSACPIDAAYIGGNLADARALKADALAGEDAPGFGCRRYHGRTVDFLYDGGIVANS